MNCRQAQTYLDDLLIAGTDAAASAELAGHLGDCPRCAREHEAAKHTLALIQPTQKIHATTNLKEQIMNQIAQIDTPAARPVAPPLPAVPKWFPRLAVNVAIGGLAVAAALLIFRQPVPQAFSMFSGAYAAEAALFAGDKIVYLKNEILVQPVDNPVLAGM
jgi:hypothetical protein